MTAALAVARAPACVAATAERAKRRPLAGMVAIAAWVSAGGVLAVLAPAARASDQFAAGLVQVVAALVLMLPEWRRRRAVRDLLATWEPVRLSERAAAQQHYLAICRLLRFPTPAEIDPDGYFYAFERRAVKAPGNIGFADVWYRDRFAIEYKGHHADLDDAYLQLLDYRVSLGNPPLLITCDLYCFRIHTNFPNTEPEVYSFTIEDLIHPEIYALLRDAFTRPQLLRPPRKSR